MTRRRRWRESVKSFIGSHIDPEKEEQLKGTKTDVEEKVKKILTLIKEEDLEEKDRITGENSKKEPLADLIEDFHTHYQTLYEQYDHLTQQLKKKFHSKRETDTSSSSSSDAEPDYSSKDKGSKNGQLQNENRIMADGIMQELQTVNLEVADLKLKLAAATEEKEALTLEYQKALNKIEEEEEITLDLKHEVGKLETEHKKLLTENEELHQKLDAASKMESELNQRVEEVNKEKLGLTVEKETAIKSFEEGKRTIEEFRIVTNQLKDEKGILIEQLENLEEKISVMRQQMESSEQQVLDLSQNLTAAEKENKSLTLEASLLDKRLEDVYREKDNLEREKQTAAKNAEEDKKITEGLRVLVDQLKVEKVALEEELKTLHGELSNLKQQLESSEQKSSDLVDNLRAIEEENNSLTWKASEITNEIQLAQSTIKELVAGSNELKEKMGEKEKELLSLAKVHEEHEAHSSARIKELESQLTDLELEIQSLQNHNRDMAMHIEKEVSETNQLRGEILELQVRISECEIISKERGDELSILRKKLEVNENESMARVENLKAQLNTLLVDMDSLRAQKAELEDKLVSSSDEASNQIKCLMDKINLLQQELEEFRIVTNQLKDEKGLLIEQLENLEEKISVMRQQMESSEQQVLDLSQNLTAAEKENKSLTLEASLLDKRLEDVYREKDNLEREKQTAAKNAEEDKKITESLRVLVDQLKVEKVALEEELKTLHGELSNLKQQLESSEQKSSDLVDNLRAVEEENNSLTWKASEITNEIQLAQSTIKELVAGSNELKEKMGEKEKELLSLAKVHEEHEAHSSARIKELESQLTGLELEIQSLQNHNRDMAMHIEKEVSEANQLRGEILELQVRISECEIISKERGDELSILRKKLEVNENESMARVENLKAQLNTLLVDMDSLRAQKAELEDKLVSSSDEASNQIKCLMDKINLLQQELESLHSQKAETEVQLESRSHEISDYLIQLDNLKEEIRNKSNEQQTALEERESLMTRLNNLTLEAEILCKQKSEIEEQMKIVAEETAKFRQEIVTLQGKTSILETTVAERELQFSQLQVGHKTREDEASSQIYSLTEQVHSLQQELDCLKIENEQLKQKLEKEKQEFSESLTQIEDHKNELMNQVMDQQRMLLEKEDAYKKLTEEYKQIEGWFQECKSNLEAAEKKVIDMGEEFEKNAGSKDQIVAELEETVEDLKRDLDMKGDELNTLVDNVRTIEVKLRLSNQKLRVTEQLLTENEESFRKTEGKYQQEQKVLEQRISTLSGIIAANSEAYQMMVTDITEILSSTSMGMEALTLRYEEDSSRYKHRILEISNEIQIAKNCVLKMNNHKEQLRKEVEELKLQLWDAKDRESALTENVEELELKLRREGGEKENLARDIKQLEAKLKLFEKMVKEKDEGILDLGEEKREVIRQLCLWIDYHRSRYDYLRQILSRTPLRSQRAA